MSSSPFFSVVVPIFEKWRELETLLACFQKMDFPAEDFEVIVVNNEPEGSETQVIRGSYSYPIRLIREPLPGSYRARNTGARIAKGKWLAFTDADCLPDSAWLANARRLADEGRKVFAGDVRALSPRENPTIAELYSSLLAPNQAQYVDNGEAMTANLFVMREVFEETGGFNEGFLSGGDLEWSKRASSRHGLSFAPDVIVSHPLRSTLSTIFQKRRRVVGGMVMLARTRGERLPWLIWFVPPWLCWRVWFISDLRLSKKMQIAVLRYLVHLYGTWHRLLLKFRLTLPSRA